MYVAKKLIAIFSCVLAVVITAAIVIVAAASNLHEHRYENGVCTLCGAVQNSSATYTNTNSDPLDDANPADDYVKFGSYPQTKVSESSLVTTLNLEAGALPTRDNFHKWTSCVYYNSSSKSADYNMWYVDVTYDGSKYRGVYFIDYRLDRCDGSPTSGNYWDDIDYSTDTVYWFRYEPILWRILSKDGSTALILCETIIDSQQYYWKNTTSKLTRVAVDNYDDAYYAGDGSVSTANVYANNYKYSNIRKWLNETFYNAAFTSSEKALIKTTTVDNGADSTIDYNGNITKAARFICDDADDKVFILSDYEATNTAYGFTSYSTNNTMRQKKASDYANNQSIYICATAGYSYADLGYWWLRSPSNYFAGRARSVTADGQIDYLTYISSSYCGVVPALTISLS